MFQYAFEDEIGLWRTPIFFSDVNNRGTRW